MAGPFDPTIQPIMEAQRDKALDLMAVGKKLARAIAQGNVPATVTVSGVVHTVVVPTEAQVPRQGETGGDSDQTANIESRITAITDAGASTTPTIIAFRPGIYTFGGTSICDVNRQNLVLCGYGTIFEAPAAATHYQLSVQSDNVSIIGFDFRAPQKDWGEQINQLLGASPVDIENDLVSKQDNTDRDRQSFLSASDVQKVIFAGNMTTGGRGCVRCSRVDHGCIVHNSSSCTDSDGIHYVRGSRWGYIGYNSIERAGDDAISLISYRSDNPDDNPRSVEGCLVEHNRVSLGFARGISLHGAIDCVVRQNYVAITRLAGIAVLGIDYAGGSVWPTANNLIEDNDLDLVGMYKGTTQTVRGQVHIACFSSQSVDGTTIRNNRMREGSIGNTGSILSTQGGFDTNRTVTGNTEITINPND